MDEPFSLDVEAVSAELKIRPEIYLRIVTSFSKTLFEKLDVLTQALSNNDRETIRKTLHEIKGTSSNLRLKSIIDVEALMHDEVKGEGNLEKMSMFLELLKKEAMKFRDFINKSS